MKIWPALLMPMIIGLEIAMSAPAVGAKGFQVLYDFCAHLNCSDGQVGAHLYIDSSGNIFGATLAGGDAGDGVIFQLIANKNGEYEYARLYSFCAQTNCTDGSYPYGSLIMDTGSNIYGTTASGGANNDGEVFELMHKGSNWNLAVLYSFKGGSDGEEPIAGLTYAGAASGKLYDGTSALFGTTEFGGGGGGVAYSLQSVNGSWSEQVIYALGGAANSQSPLIMDSSGNLCGTETNSSIVYELSPANGNWSEATLYDFPCKGECTNGSSPEGGLVMDTSGRLWGLTEEGGAKCKMYEYDGFGCGTIYSLAPAGNEYTESVLHDFCSEKPRCADGGFPPDTPVLDAHENLFGTTVWGGKERGSGDRRLGSGTLFELSSNGKFSVLHTFCEQKGCGSGGYSPSGVTLDAAGNVYGTTWGGGAHKGGVVYEYSP